MTGRNLDELLSTPLASIPDAGFSRAIENRIAARERIVMAVEWSVAGLILAMLAATLPLASLTVGLSTSMPFAVACSALVLMHAMTRLMTE
jgi:hypothetical protein